MATQKTKVLRALQQAGTRGVHTAELLADPEIGSRFSARIKELRDDGKVIETIPARGGAKYVLREYEYRACKMKGDQKRVLFYTRRPDELVAWCALFGLAPMMERRRSDWADWQPLPDAWIQRLDQAARERAAARENAAGSK
jgi:hypothetical protein